jgi:hypothetical protein
MFRSFEANSGTIERKGSKDLATSSTFVVDQSSLGQPPSSVVSVNVEGTVFVKSCHFLLVMGLCWLLMSCAPWRDSYLDSGVGVLTQPDVKEKLGKPHIVDDPLLSDETTWMYRFTLSARDLDPWGVETFGKEAGSVFNGPEGALREKVYCYVYALKFDKEAVLRQWNRELCQVPKPLDPFLQGF